MYPNVKIVGMHFRGGDAREIAASLTPGSTLRLEREPDNAFDSYAIKAFVADTHIGYIERGQAMWIAPEMDEGAEMVATVTGHIEEKRNTYPVVTVERA